MKDSAENQLIFNVWLCFIRRKDLQCPGKTRFGRRFPEG